MCLVKQTKSFFCVTLYIFNKRAGSIIAKPTRKKDKTDCCLRILQNNNPNRPPHAESDPSFLSRTSFAFGSHVFFTENQRVFRKSFMFRRSGRLSSKVPSLVWNITFSKNPLLPSSGKISKTSKGSTKNDTERAHNKSETVLNSFSLKEAPGSSETLVTTQLHGWRTKKH